MKFVQGSWRMNLSLGTLRDITRLRMAEQDGYDELVAGFGELVIMEKEDDEERDREECQDTDTEPETSDALEATEPTLQNEAQSNLTGDMRAKEELLGDAKARKRLRDYLKLVDYSRITTIVRPQVRSSTHDSGNIVANVLKEFQTNRENRSVSQS